MPAGRAPKPASLTASPVPPAAEGGPSMSITSSEKCLHEAATISTAWVGGGGAGVRPRFAASGPKARVRAHPDAGGHFQSERCPREVTFVPLYFSPSTNFPATEVPHMSAHHEASGIIPSMQGHVVRAFSLLQGSPEVQLASNKNVWDAIMKNEKVMEFYRTYMSSESTGRSVIADFAHDVKHKVVETVINKYIQLPSRTFGDFSRSFQFNQHKD
ncbi:unnamed protein product [Musa hybrid cultivar]